MKSMKNNKTPDHDGLIKKFCEISWDKLKTPLMESINWAFYTKVLGISQTQAVIKLTEKKDRDKRRIKSWRPISLLNVDTKILSKAVSDKLKAVLSTLIFSQQTAYVKNRFIGENGRLISDKIKIIDWFNIEECLVTMDIEKLDLAIILSHV